MNCWDSKGNAVCNNCGKTRAGHEDRRVAVNYLRAGGWHHSQAKTLGGNSYEAILCPQCVTGEKKKIRQQSTLDSEPLPFDWETMKGQPERGHGFSSR